MILQRITAYIKFHQRVEETLLLKEFHLHKSGLAPMMDVLIKTGKIQKTINTRGAKLSAQIFYTWQTRQVIPMTTLL